MIADSEKLEELSLSEKRALLARLLQDEASEVETFPLSFAQQRLWFLTQLEPHNSSYHIPLVLSMKGPLNREALRQTLSTIVERHETLRTTFKMQKGEPVQIVSSSPVFELPFIDLRTFPSDTHDVEASRLQLMEAQRPFALEREFPFRATLVCLGDQYHWLLVTIHHIAGDGWSIGVFTKELSGIYEALSQNKPVSLTELPIQYVDYAQWQRDWLSGDVLQQQLNYWKKRLEGAPAVLDLPVAKSRPELQSTRGAHLRKSLASELSRSIVELGRSEGATLFMVLLAAFETLLYRYSGQEDFVIGSPIAGRNQVETEDLIGFFVNSLPLRVELGGNPSFREVLQRVKESTLEAYTYQDVPFERIVEELQPERSLSFSPIFQVMFAFQNQPRASFNLPNLSVEFLKPRMESAKFDLMLFMAGDERGLSCLLEYCADLFEPENVTRLLKHFEVLLDAIVANPDRPIATLPLLDEVERRQLVTDWNQTATEKQSETSIHQLFEESARAFPDGVAVEFDADRLTYAELNQRANQLAHYLRAHGAGPEVLVGICVERSLEMIVGLLGVLKSGAAFVALDPSYPADRIAFMLSDAGVKLLLTQERLLGDLPQHEAMAIALDRDWPEISKSHAHDPSRNVLAQNLAYVIYTSGSTGTPKGVAIAHENTVAMLQWAQNVFTAEELSGVLASTSICFDLSVFEIFLPLSVGGRVILAENALQLPELPAKESVRLVNTVPSAIVELLRLGAIPANVSTVNLAGEALQQSVVEELYELGIKRVYDLYGPSEDTTYSTFALRASEGAATIGRPIDNSQVYLLDRHGQLVPRGVPGELYLGGAGLARGYLRRPEQTAERWVPNPFDGKGTRLYRTGDLARYLEDGNLQYLGRIDNQVKLRGFRIELGEIEAALKHHPLARDVVVVTRTDSSGSMILCGYVVVDASPQAQQTLSSDFRTLLKKRLPEYMVPSAFVFLEQIPLTPNGKVDRRALPVPEISRTQLQEDFTATRTPTEEIVASIWAAVLNVDTVGAHDNFFELGGHSLLATQVISRLRQTFQVELPLRIIFERPTVESLAAGIDASMGEFAADVKVFPRAGDEFPPLSFAQQRLWFLDQLEGESASYNIPWAARLRGELDEAALHAALTEIVSRHESLRTRFDLIEGEPVQIIEPPAELDFSLSDLSQLAAERKEAAARELTAETGRRTFNLSRGPIIRIKLIRLDITDHVLLISIHHIASDGWSIGVLVRELTQLYEAYSKGEDSPLLPLKIQYADYAVWQRDWLAGDKLRQQLGYWRNHLNGAPAVLELPTDRPRPAIQTFNGDYHVAVLSPELSKGLRDLARREQVTLFMLLLGSFQALLSRYANCEDVVVGTPIANRNRRETEDLIGFFVNTLALRTDLSGNPKFTEVLARVREVALGGYAHQDLPFERLVEDLQPERSLSHMPLFQVFFALQNAPAADSKLTKLVLSGFPFDRNTSKFDLSLYASEVGDRLKLSFEYNTDLYDRSTIERMAANLETLLDGIVSDPRQRLFQLPLVTETEREWHASVNETEATYRTDTFVHRLFEEQARKSPDQTAVRFGNEQLTYGELNQRANQLARHLQNHGVRVETVVGILLDRSPEMLVALLGVLKAGAAYLPLDSLYPGERLSFMLDDAGVNVLLTETSSLGHVGQFCGTIIALDDQREVIASEPAGDLKNSLEPDNLAYVIYTSGSTGKPKGVQISHRSLVNFLTAMRNEPGLSPNDVVVAVTTLTFDIAGLELYLPLTVGAAVELVSRDVAADGNGLAELISRSGATVMQATPATWRLLIEVGWQGSKNLKILSGGERLPPDLADSLVARGAEVWNLYGPTETTIWSTIRRVDDSLSRITVGRPIANTQTFILDHTLQPVPIGVSGGLYIGGDGIARGYLKRPDLTADRFLPNPFSQETGARMYDTGDIARYLRDGDIELVGRSDHQVKVRGFRIELGEIESAVSSHPKVSQSVAAVTEMTSADQRVVAYFVPATDTLLTSGGEPEWQNEQLAQWQTVWDQAYAAGTLTPDPTFNISGWNSSYTGLPIPAEEMRAWVDHTVDRILSLNPNRVLEIGCGTGLLLFRVAPHCNQYIGTDFSQQALDYIARHVPAGTRGRIELRKQAADQLTDFEACSLDAIVLNSVAQYFPGVEYLLKVLELALEKVRPGGAIFIGDVRSLPLLEVFHASVQLHQAADSLSRAELAQRVRRHVDQEEELVIDPRLFSELQQRLPRIAEVEVLVKPGKYDNELSRFRYDVILRVGEKPVAEAVQQIDWERHGLDYTSLRQLLVENKPDTLTVTRIPNVRLAEHVEMLKLIADETGAKNVGEIRAALADFRADLAADPDALSRFGEELSYHVELSCASSDHSGCFDAVFRRRGVARSTKIDSVKPLSAAPPHKLANNPLRGKMYNALVPELRDFLRTRLPEYMVPQVFVMLDALPLTASGKVDRRALPTPTTVRADRGRDLVEPRTEYELVVKGIWEELLQISPIGIKDDFFDLGGHSLLAVRMVNELEKIYGRRIPLVSLFQGATIESLAAFLRQDNRQNSWPTLIEIQKGEGEQPLFCVSTPNVNALGYIFLARHLDSSQPVYGLQAQYPEDLQGEHSQIVVEELAVEYLAAMRTLQPRGPYQLVGMCRGAHIAHEMARLLEADGERVELLGILDTWVLENTYNRFLYLTYYARRLQALWQMSFQARNKLIAAKLRSLRGRSNSEGQAETFLRNPLAAYWPGAEYKPKLISGRLAVFRARRQPLDRIRDRALGWQRLTTGEVEVFSVPGLHGTLLREPHVKVLAKALQSRLQSGTNNGSKP